MIALFLSVSSFAELNIDEKNLLNGERVTLQVEKQSKGIVILFLSVSCGCTESHLAHLEKLNEEYRQDFKFIGILANEEEDIGEAVSFFKKKNISFPIVRNEKIALDLNATKTPSVYVLDKKLQLLYSGGISNNVDFNKSNKLYLKEALSEITNNQPIKIKNQKVLGCSI
ncbi:MAG: redoxin domain-containing protein [Deltaproteobacteria bacterium]|nr:redoxin domain-containing protein [Deltaproteobacteria bacterium]